MRKDSESGVWKATIEKASGSLFPDPALVAGENPQDFILNKTGCVPASRTRSRKSSQVFSERHLENTDLVPVIP